MRRASIDIEYEDQLDRFFAAMRYAGRDGENFAEVLEPLADESGIVLCSGTVKDAERAYAEGAR